MKIGIDGALLHRKVTGTERYIHNVFTNLCSIGQENEYTIYTKQQVFPPDQLPANASERSFTLRSEMVMQEFLGEAAPPVDLYHMTWFGNNCIDLLPLHVTPVSVLTVLDLMLFRYSSYFLNEDYHEAYRRQVSFAVQMADMIIAISNHTKSDILATFDIPSERVEAVHLGLDHRFYTVKDKEPVDRVRARHGLEKPLVFYLGTDYPHKNHRNLIKAFHHLVKERKLSAQLLLAGPRCYSTGEDELKKLIDDLHLRQEIVWLEHIDDDELNALYNAADVFVYPSLDEGFGLPLLEAMACGTPVAASNAASIPEVGGDAALYFDPTNVSEMATAIERVLKDNTLRNDLIQRGYEHCAELTWEKTAEQTLKVYDKARQMAEESVGRATRDRQRFERALLREIMHDHERLEKHCDNLQLALDLREQHLETVMGARSLRYYRKVREALKKIIGF